MRQTRNSTKNNNNDVQKIDSSSQVKHKATRKRTGKQQITRSPHIRHLIIMKSSNHLKTPTEISKELDIPRETVAGIIKRYEKTGSSSYKDLGGDLRSIIQEHHRKFIVDAVDENNVITLEELRTKIINHFSDINRISISTICNYLKYVERLIIL